MKEILHLFAVLFIAVLVTSCTNSNKNGKIQISYGTDTVSHGDVPLIAPEKYDSAINAIQNADSFGVYFHKGFNNTNVELLEENTPAKTFTLTTNPSNEIAAFKILAKKHKYFVIKMDGETYSLKIIKKYFLLYIDYDKNSKGLNVEYSNSLRIMM